MVLGVGLSLGLARHSARKTDSLFQNLSFASSSSAGVGASCSHLPSKLGHCMAWCYTSIVNVVINAGGSYVPLPFSVNSKVSLYPSTLSVSCNLSIPLFCNNLWALGREAVIQVSDLRLNTLQSLILCIFTSSGSLLIMTYYENLLWWRLRDALIYVYYIQQVIMSQFNTVFI